MFKNILLFFVLASCACAEDLCCRSGIAHLLAKGDIEKGIDSYIEYYNKSGAHDFELLEQIGNKILADGTSCSSVEDQLLTIFGIGVSGNRSAYSFLMKALNSHYPMVQAAAVQVASQIHEDFAEDMIASAMKSDFLMIRMEALFHLIVRRAKNALGHVESLINLLPPQFKPIFIDFYPLYGSNEAICKLKQFLSDQDINVRLAAILSVAAYGRDDLLPNIRSVATHPDPVIKEAAAFALGGLKDLGSVEILKIISSSPFYYTKLAGLHALFKIFGDKSFGDEIISMARESNSFAIQILHQIPGAESLLEDLVSNKNFDIRLNAAMSLLKMRSHKSLDMVLAILSTDLEYTGFIPIISPGRSMVAWNRVALSCIPSADMQRNIKAMSLSLQEEILHQCVELEEESFLRVCKYIMDGNHTKLVPSLMRIMENHPTKEIVNLLKENSNKVGSPIVRAYCNLALYRLGADEGFCKNFLKWVSAQKASQIIEFKLMMDRGVRKDKNVSNYQLSPEEKSGLLIESLEAISSKHDTDGINIILDAIRKGNPKNRYALAGVLLKSIH